MTQFEKFSLDKQLLLSFKKQGYETPTEVQGIVLPLALAGKDVLVASRTGTGKTIAFLAPLITKLLNTPNNAALIITPTREIAIQIQNVIKNLELNLRSALLIGGDDMRKQIIQLKKNPQIIIGTPGRINDHIRRRSVNFKNNIFLVLDEADRMLEMGFEVDLKNIIKLLNDERQTMMFSATLSKKIEKIAQQYLTNPESINLCEMKIDTTKIAIENFEISEGEKFTLLCKKLDGQAGSVIVFSNTKMKTDKLASQLVKNKYSAEVIHGDLRQHKREKVIRSFRNKQCKILVATDVAARGIDITHIECVINYDLPFVAEDYIHRVGRTARAEKSGQAFNFISPADKKKWLSIKKLVSGGEPDEPSRGGGERRSSGNNRRRDGSNRSQDNRRSKFGKFSSNKDRDHSRKNSNNFRNGKNVGSSENRLDGEGSQNRSYKAKFGKFSSTRDRDSRKASNFRSASSDSGENSFINEGRQNKSYKPKFGNSSSARERDNSRKASNFRSASSDSGDKGFSSGGGQNRSHKPKFGGKRKGFFSKKQTN
jgi:superfamily II DNA/RNA helicase